MKRRRGRDAQGQAQHLSAEGRLSRPRPPQNASPQGPGTGNANDFLRKPPQTSASPRNHPPANPLSLYRHPLPRPHTTEPRPDPQRVGMYSGQRPTGAANSKQTSTMASCHPPPPCLQARPYPRDIHVHTDGGCTLCPWAVRLGRGRGWIERGGAPPPPGRPANAQLVSQWHLQPTVTAPRPLWQPPPTAFLTASEAPSSRMHPCAAGDQELSPLAGGVVASCVHRDVQCHTGSGLCLVCGLREGGPTIGRR